MSGQVPSTDEAVTTPDSRRWAVIALCLLLVGIVTVVTGVMLAFTVPVGLIVLGALLLGAGIVLGLMT